MAGDDDLRRSLLEGALTTLRDADAPKSVAYQTGEMVLAGKAGSIRAGVEPDDDAVARMIERLEIEQAKVGKYTEKLHPRSRKGQFMDKPDSQEVGARGGVSKSEMAPRKPKPSTPKPTDKTVNDREPGSHADAPINVGGDLEKAAKLLSEGKHVELDQPHEVSTLVKRLGDMVNDAQKKGGPMPTFDLCKVSVPGTNLFCTESKKIPRIQMPQLGGVPTKGSKADKLPKDSRGEVDLNDLFREHLESQGVKFHDETDKASFLRATQDQLNGGKVAGIADAIRGKSKYTYDEKRLFVSKDGYIVDGHHRWAAKVAVDTDDGKLGDVTMPIARADLGIGSLLFEANRFAEEWGIPQAGVAQFAKQIKEAAASPCAGPETPCVDYSDVLAEAIADAMASRPQAKRERPQDTRRPKPAAGPKGRDGKPANKPQQPSDESFEKAHPRGRGGVWVKKGQGMNAAGGDPQVAQAQRRLAQLGYASGAPDGKNGPLTQAAISKFQAAYGLRQTGEIDPATYQTMTNPPEKNLADQQAANREAAAMPNAQGETPGGAGGSSASGGTEAAGASKEKDGSGRESGGTTTLDTADSAAVRQFQQAHGLKADGIVGPNTQAMMKGLGVAAKGEGSEERNSDGTVTSSRDGEGASSDERKTGKGDSKNKDDKGKKALIGEGADGPAVRTLQQGLEALGYDLGKSGVDGEFGAYTDRAVRKLQREHGLKADGKVGRRTARLIKRLMKHQSDRVNAKSTVKSADELAETITVDWEHADATYRARAPRRAVRPEIDMTRYSREAVGVTVDINLIERFDEATADRLVAQEAGLHGAAQNALAVERRLATRIVESYAEDETDHGSVVRAFRMSGKPMVLVEAMLKSKARNALPDSAFALPGERRYPIHDESHARNALSRASGKPEEKQVRAAVKRKHPKIMEADTSPDRTDPKPSCAMPHKAMSAKGMRKCPKCGAGIGETRKTMQEAMLAALLHVSAERAASALTEADLDDAYRIGLAECADGALDLSEAADSLIKASTHKKGLEKAPGKKDNWIESVGGQLPAYVQHIALAIKKKGRTTSQAIAIAIGTIKRWAAGAGDVDAKTRAAAAKALAEWNALKARAKAAKAAT